MASHGSAAATASPPALETVLRLLVEAATRYVEQPHARIPGQAELRNALAAAHYVLEEHE